MAQPNFLIVGLGNPGDAYERTRHNIGFLVLDALSEEYKCSHWKSKFRGSILAPPTPHVLLLKPMTFMNNSGESVSEAATFYKLTADKVIVIHDDLDLLPGQVKVKFGGGSGGHNGLKSIDAHIGQDYWRVRIGIGHPGMKGDAVTAYVLSNFSKTDIEWLSLLLKACAHNFDSVLEGQGNLFARSVMNALRIPKERT